MKITAAFTNMRNFIKSNRAAKTATSIHTPSCYVPMTEEMAPLQQFPQDKTLLLKPLNDEHLIEVYREAKAMKLSEDFIHLIEDALTQRNIQINSLPY